MEPIERQCHRMKTSRSSVARIVCRSSSSQRRRSPAGVSQGHAAHPQLIPCPSCVHSSRDSRLGVTLIGMINGAAIAALFSGWLETILYGVSRHDFATLAGVAVLMCLVTGVATYGPARRAASVDPIAALREG